jgi:minor extracellular serine protease Vpr
MTRLLPIRSGSMLLLTATLLCLPALSQAAGPIKRKVTLNSNSFHMVPLVGGPPEIEVFVRLDEPAVAELNISSLTQTGKFASSESQKAQAAKVTTQQANFRSILQSHGARILSSQRVGANGFRIRVRASEIAGISNLAGVRSVGRVEKHYVSNVTSVPWIGAPAVWSSVGKGKGIKIAIIDTGIDYTHADFGGAGTPEAYSSNDPTVIEPGTFPTAKVKGGIDLAGAAYNADDPTSVPVPDKDPLDGAGHGSHVAGTAAGIGVPGIIGAGVAPEADLYAVKIFGDEGSTELTSLGIEWAMDPDGDGDMNDHLDVINMSLGGDFGEPDDPSTISSDNAAALGIVVVAAAGNAGATPYVVSSPSVSPATISVASSLPGGREYPRLTVTAPASVAGVYNSIEGAGGTVTIKQVAPLTGALVPTVPVDGCTPITNVVAAKVALIKRGTCTFIEKFAAAQAAGAKAVIVYNDGTAPDRQDPIAMGLDATIHIPGVMISASDGTKLAAVTGVQVKFTSELDPTKDDQISTFSSLGPSSDNQAFKPDLTAPGDSIVSVGFGTGNGSANFSGTSMATPHVAGSAALLLQEHPDLSPQAIKALLQNSTVNANKSGDTRLTRQGTGVIRVDRASALTSYASPGGVSFGRLNPVLPVQDSETITLTNLANKNRSFSVKHVPNRTLPGVDVSCPSSISVRAKRSETARLHITVNPIAMAKQGISDDAFQSQTEVDGWCVFSDGKDSLRVGYIAVVDPASTVFALPASGLRSVDIRNFGPGTGWVEGFTLAKLGGEELNRTKNSIAAVGFRRADPAFYAGQNVLEIAVATERPFNHPSSLTYELLIDTNSDGKPDVDLVGTDETHFDPTVDSGTFLTAQFDATGNGFLDWLAVWDFNDRAIILPFTLTSSDGFVTEKFSYTLTITAADGTVDTQHGTVDLGKEIVPDVNSFGIDAGDVVHVKTSNAGGTSLWLFQNNQLAGQTGLSFTLPPKK